MLCKPLGTASGLEVEAGMFGVAMAAVGMLSIVGMIVSNDAYGPIVDNARGLVEMGGLGEDVIETTGQTGLRRKHSQSRHQGLFDRCRGTYGSSPFSLLL